MAAERRGGVIVERGDGGDAGGVLGASRSPRSAARHGREVRARLTRRPEDAPGVSAVATLAVGRRAMLAAILSSVVCVVGAGGGYAQGSPDEPTLQEMAARDDVAGLARAINRGVAVDVRDAAGETALHVAAHEAHLFAVMMLLAKGADPNARDGKRRTPLHLAAEREQDRVAERYQVVKLLVAKGSDLEAVDDLGKRPVDYVRSVEFERELAPPVTSRRASPRPSRGSR